MSKHYNFIINNFFIYAADYATESVLFSAEGEMCCELYGVPVTCASVAEFYELIDLWAGESLEW